MKKVATALALAMGFSMLGQKLETNPNALNKSAVPAKADPYLDEDYPGAQKSTPTPKGKSSAAVLWSEDFGSGFSSPNGNWVASGMNSNLVMYDSNGPDSLLQFNWGPLPSPTASNGFAIFDFYARIPDVNGFATSPAEGLLTSPTINLNSPDVFLSLHQQIFHCCNLNLEVFIEVSTDGGATWPAANRFKTNIVDRNARHWDLGLGYYFEYDLSGILSGNPTNNVKIRFNWTSTSPDANGQYSNNYFWMIDDIEISDLPRHKVKFTDFGGAPAHDFIVDGDGANTKTGVICLDEALPISFDSNVFNFGTDDQTGVDLQVQIYDASGNLAGTVQSSSNSTLLKGDTLDFNSLTTSAWTPTATGNYTFVYSVISDSIPVSLNAEVVRDSFPLVVTDSVTSIDFSTFGNSVGTSELGNDGSALAVRYHLAVPSFGNTMVEIPDLIIDYSTATVAGGDIQIEVYDTTGFDFQNGFGGPALVSKAFTLGTPEDNGAVVSYDLSINGTPLMVNPGSYYFVVYMFSNQGNNRVAIANDQTFPSTGTSAVMFDIGDARWYVGYNDSKTFNAPFIKVKKNPNTIGLEEVVRTDYMNIYPNPSDGHLAIEMEQGGTFKLDLVNTAGQVVDSRPATANGGEKIDLNYTNVAPGTYFLKVEGKNYHRTARIVIQ